ncbi:MAG: dethiobiotin synthase [Deltaproteobacteria bacterium]|nr:dethiobiotin synthase [Candidatus Deferrimicrobiaceae bacterium]
MKAFLITGTDTGAGKTRYACLLGSRLVAEGVAVSPFKPVESGCAHRPGEAPFPEDAAALRDAIAPGMPLSEICPHPLAAALSPHLAARGEGVSIDPVRIREAAAAAARSSEVLLVEGAGGIAVEIREGYTFADLARDLSLTVLVVAENRLGVLNHLRLTLRYLASEGLAAAGVVLNDRSADLFPAREANEAEVRRISGDRYLGRIPHGAAALPEDSFLRFRTRFLAT